MKILTMNHKYRQLWHRRAVERLVQLIQTALNKYSTVIRTCTIICFLKWERQRTYTEMTRCKTWIKENLAPSTHFICIVPLVARWLMNRLIIQVTSCPISHCALLKKPTNINRLKTWKGSSRREWSAKLVCAPQIQLLCLQCLNPKNNRSLSNRLDLLRMKDKDLGWRIVSPSKLKLIGPS